jgi:hypothetical protein
VVATGSLRITGFPSATLLPRIGAYAADGPLGRLAIFASTEVSYRAAQLYAARAIVDRPLTIFRELHGALAERLQFGSGPKEVTPRSRLLSPVRGVAPAWIRHFPVGWHCSNVWPKKASWTWLGSASSSKTYALTVTERAKQK